MARVIPYQTKTGLQIGIYYEPKINHHNPDQDWIQKRMLNVKPDWTYHMDNLIEYEVAPGVYGSGAANNTIAYTNNNGQTFTTFSQFAIKVILATSDKTNPPFLTDIRALALPPGTGI